MSELLPHPPRIGLSFPSPRKRNWLAGEAAGEEVDFRGLLIYLPHILIAWNQRPVLLQDLPAEGIRLSLPDDLHACPLEAKVDPAYA